MCIEFYARRDSGTGAGSAITSDLFDDIWDGAAAMADRVAFAVEGNSIRRYAISALCSVPVFTHAIGGFSHVQIIRGKLRTRR